MDNRISVDNTQSLREEITQLKEIIESQKQIIENLETQTFPEILPHNKVLEAFTLGDFETIAKSKIPEPLNLAELEILWKTKGLSTLTGSESYRKYPYLTSYVSIVYQKPTLPSFCVIL